MSAEIRCLVCHWQSRQPADAIEDYKAHWCVKSEELEPTDEQWEIALGRLMHPSMGGDVA